MVDLLVEADSHDLNSGLRVTQVAGAGVGEIGIGRCTQPICDGAAAVVPDLHGFSGGAGHG